MASKFTSSPALNIDNYNTWKKEIQVWEMAMSGNIETCSHCTLISRRKNQKGCIRIGHLHP